MSLIIIYDKFGIFQNLQTSPIPKTNFLAGTFLPLLTATQLYHPSHLSNLFFGRKLEWMWSKIFFKYAYPLFASTIYNMITKFFDEIGILQRFWPNFEATWNRVSFMGSQLWQLMRQIEVYILQSGRIKAFRLVSRHEPYRGSLQQTTSCQ